jgi:hypothetical protein
MYPLRSNNCKLYLEKPKTDFMKKSFSYRGSGVASSISGGGGGGGGRGGGGGGGGGGTYSYIRVLHY